MTDDVTRSQSGSRAAKCEWCFHEVYKDGRCISCYIKRKPPPKGFHDWHEYDSWVDYRMHG